jgi:hypothetical protein
MDVGAIAKVAFTGIAFTSEDRVRDRSLSLSGKLMRF